MITQNELKQYLDYNKDTGIFKWKINGNNQFVKIGSVAGSVNKSIGYIVIQINKKLYLAHRLAWLYVYGEFPNQEIDHINHDKTDNWIANLRVVSHQENQKNRTKPKNNASGHVGVYWCKQKNKWRARINSRDKVVHLGYFINLEEAVEARKQANINYGFHDNHGAA